jgi:hypothetical protein
MDYTTFFVPKHDTSVHDGLPRLECEIKDPVIVASYCETFHVCYSTANTEARDGHSCDDFLPISTRAGFLLKKFEGLITRYPHHCYPNILLRQGSNTPVREVEECFAGARSLENKRQGVSSPCRFNLEPLLYLRGLNSILWCARSLYMVRSCIASHKSTKFQKQQNINFKEQLQKIVA